MVPMEPPDRTQVNTDRRGLPSARAEEFRAALARDGAPDWEPFLSALTGADREAALAEFVALDLAHRWGRGERARLEGYVGRFPAPGPLGGLPVALIREEVRSRVAAGDHPQADEYRRRFPVQ